MAGNIRNFVIIAHVDHGKSTLADRFLELTGAVEKRHMKEQFLDQMELELEKGITIKLQPVRLKYKDFFMVPAINKIDLPSARVEEVSRSIADLLTIEERDILRVSAKTVEGVKELLEAVVARGA